MTNPTLDQPELLHLALEAARRDDHGQAITYLKQALDLPEGAASSSTDYARLLYLLGAEYAQIGLMDRAREQMARAIEMDPSLHTARFQLGLLLLTQAQPEAALEVLAPLKQLGPQQAFFHFEAGLTHLIRDEFDACRTSLHEGMELNAASPAPNLALNADMQKILDALPAADGGDKSAEASFMMSAYNRGSGDAGGGLGT